MKSTHDLCLALACSILLGVVVAADPPTLLNYQGVLRDGNDDPLDGDFDMIFRFFDDVAAGSEILVDEHLALGAGAVTVSGGLFNVGLGGGSVADGSGAGVFSDLAEVFRDHQDVWLEIVVDGETLSPRVRVTAAAYALNASHLQGRAASEFLDTSAIPQEKTGLLTASGGVDFGAGADDDLTAADVSTLTSGGSADALHTHTFVGSAGDSDLLDGVDSSQFLRSDASDTFASGTLTLAPGTILDVDGSTFLDGELFMDQDGPDGLQAIYFYDAGAPTGASVLWDDTNGRFEVSGDTRLLGGLYLDATESLRWDGAGLGAFDLSDHLKVRGALNAGFFGGAPVLYNTFGSGNPGVAINSDDVYVKSDLEVDDQLWLAGELYLRDALGPEGDQSIYFFNSGTATGESLVWDDDPGNFLFSDHLWVSGQLRTFSSLYVNSDGPEGDGTIYFYNNGSALGESLQWDDSTSLGRFELSDDLSIRGTLRVGTTNTSQPGYNTIASQNLANHASTSEDLYVRGLVEVDNYVILNGELRMDDGPDGDQDIEFYNAGSSTAERLQWDDSADRFEFSDALAVFGDLSATGAKPFVQNHPYDEELEVVFVALEGDEVTTFTRGMGKLEGGEARIALGSTFALVTNPDLGLTAHLTPFDDCEGLYVESVTTEELVVRERNGGTSGAGFGFIVYGLRIGYEEYPALRRKRAEAYVPPPGFWADEHRTRPELRSHSALARYSEMTAAVRGVEPGEFAAARALRAAIGEQDPGFDYPVGSTVPPARAAAVADGAAELDIERVRARPPGTVGDEAAEPVVAGPRGSRVFQDEEGNLYANSFRPESGGMAGYQSLSEPVELGDVVSVDPNRPGFLKLSSHEADTAVVGIVSGEPGFALEAASAAAPDVQRAPVALSGIVLCNVDAAVRPIAVGDLLTTSPIPGHAMRADDPAPGTILGKALEPLDGGTGRIRVLVMQR